MNRYFITYAQKSSRGHNISTQMYIAANDIITAYRRAEKHLKKKDPKCTIIEIMEWKRD